MLAGYQEATKAAMGQWIACLRAQAVALALVSDERAEVIVRAAKTACFSEQGKWLAALAAQNPGASGEATMVAQLDRVHTDFLTLDVIKARAARLMPPPHPAPAEPAPHAPKLQST